VDGQQNRSYPGRPWPRVPSVRDPHQFPGPGAHGRIADGGGPGPHLTAHIRWSAAFDSGRRRAVCKTVGSAYVGSNPTPATTSENGPPAAETRPDGPFLLVTPCIAVCHRGSMRCGVHGRIADGVRAARTVGAHRRLFHGRPRQGPRGAHSGFACSAEPGACARTRVPRLAAPGVPGGLRGVCVPICCRGGAWWIDEFSGDSRAPGGWRRVARPAALREAWRHGMRIAVPRAGRRAVAGAAPRVARTDAMPDPRACGAAWSCNSDVPADSFRAPGSAACSARVRGELAARV
jgi:hypothetical protein